jgi:hypothetical protein
MYSTALWIETGLKELGKTTKNFPFSKCSRSRGEGKIKNHSASLTNQSIYQSMEKVN